MRQTPAVLCAITVGSMFGFAGTSRAAENARPVAPSTESDAAAVQGDYDYEASLRAAETWPAYAARLAPQRAPEAALDPGGTLLVASTPVPDTPANRLRYGGPMSISGRLTAAIGD